MQTLELGDIGKENKTYLWLFMAFSQKQII